MSTRRPVLLAWRSLSYWTVHVFHLVIGGVAVLPFSWQAIINIIINVIITICVVNISIDNNITATSSINSTTTTTTTPYNNDYSPLLN